MTKNQLYIAISYISIFRHTDSYGVISLHELKGNGVLHVFELIWISVRRAALLPCAVSRAVQRDADVQQKRDTPSLLGLPN